MTSGTLLKDALEFSGIDDGSFFHSGSMRFAPERGV
jgi:hypothetical protein